MSRESDRSRRGYAWHRLAGLIGGPAAAVAMLAFGAPAGMPAGAWTVAAVVALMASWWMTEALPLAVTALVPLALFPALGINTLDGTASAYADPLIFLFLGGFMLAAALERWRLGLRLALGIVRLGGSEPARIVASVMAVTAFLSMWVSNTAAAIVMLPIGLSIIGGARAANRWLDQRGLKAFAAALMLGIAYAASIGGMATLIGTPPNALFAAYVRDAYGVIVPFGRWLLVGVPVVAILLPLAWLVLTKLAFPVPRTALGRGEDSAAAGIALPGPPSRGEWMAGAVFVLTVLCWIVLPFLRQRWPALELSDSGVAIVAAVLLFVLPVHPRRGVFVLGWRDVRRLPWNVLILFGGGLALGEAMGRSGLADLVGESVVALGGLPPFVLVIVVSGAVVLLGELASNTAIAALFLPIAGAASVGIGESPLVLALSVALAASIGFMLPVATPPNAIVFGSGLVSAAQMLRAGIILDAVGVAVVSLAALALGAWLGDLPAPTPAE